MSEKQRSSSPFLAQYLKGEALADDIDDCIDAWHERPGRKKIFEFLGMTKEEYSLWLCDPDSLPEIARARRVNVPLAGVVRDVLADMGPAENPRAKPLRQWLAQQAETHPAE